VHIYQSQAPLNVRSLAVVVSQLVIEHKDDERLKWYPENGRVRILIGKILPNVSAVESTLISRRKRFRNALKILLCEEGWTEIGVHTYTQKTIK
jgi:hypothetical protein